MTGVQTCALPICDDAALIQDRIAAGAQHDLLITLGGASVGDHDLVQKALATRGLAVDFWKIAMRPGKPLMWGRLGDLPVLGLTSWYSTIDLTSCLATATPGILDSTLRQLVLNPASARHRDAQVAALSTINLPAVLGEPLWKALAFGAPTAPLRGTAASALLGYLQRAHPSAPESMVGEPEIQADFRDLLAQNHTGEVLRYALLAPALTHDADALPQLAEIVREVPFALYARQAVCGARQVTATDSAHPDAFETFAAPLRRLTYIPQSVHEALDHADACSPGMPYPFPST